ncbi:BlaI/MecI/CopY family transcriptional regulator [bacterium]|nr:BlaI/MecI/CopY family transcriptional regulator [bacterium]
MARKSSDQPTELELRILRILWDDSPLPVREVRQRLADSGRDLAHTTVITTLNVMVDKGQLKRKKDGKAFLFSPKIAREKTSREMLGRLVDRVFDGSASAVMASLFDHNDPDTEELVELRRLLNKKLKEKR